LKIGTRRGEHRQRDEAITEDRCLRESLGGKKKRQKKNFRVKAKHKPGNG